MATEASTAVATGIAQRLQLISTSILAGLADAVGHFNDMLSLSDSGHTSKCIQGKKRSGNLAKFGAERSGYLAKFGADIYLASSPCIRTY